MEPFPTISDNLRRFPPYFVAFQIGVICHHVLNSFSLFKLLFANFQMVALVNFSGKKIKKLEGKMCLRNIWGSKLNVPTEVVKMELSITCSPMHSSTED